MFKVLIVDDEPATRNTIKKLLQCFNGEFEVAGEAANGVQGFNLIKETNPDILILDIKMPEMDGISLMNKIRKCNINCKIIILTAYHDFDYAREALKLSALDYLMKPVGRNDLRKVLDKAANLIIKERESLERDKAVKSLLNKSTNAYRDAILNQLVDGDNYDKIESDLPIVFTSKFSHAVVMLFNIQERLSNTLSFSELKHQIDNKIGSLVKGFCFTDKDKRLVFIDLFDVESDDEKLSELASEHAQIIQYAIFKITGFHVSAGIGKNYKDLRNLYKSYSEAIIALEYRFVFTDKSIISFGSCKNSDIQYRYPSKSENRLINALMLADCDSAVTNLNMFFGELSCKKLNPASIKQVCMQLGMSLLKVIKEMGIAESMPDIEDSCFFDMSRYETIIDFKTQLALVIHKIAALINENNKLKEEYRFKNMIDSYLERNYSRNIGLFDVAKELGISSNYFSSLFKKEVGENFVEHLTKYRIQKAKIIMDRDNMLSVSKVAEMVGFNDARYFFRVFKKLEGITPKKYCQVANQQI